MPRPRHASASTCAWTGSPCVVRSPASRTRSASRSTRANASAILSRVASDACTSPAAAIVTMRPCSTSGREGKPAFRGRGSARDLQAAAGHDEEGGGRARDAGIEFALGGGLASWARGGPESEHDVDFLVRPEDAERAQAALADAGMRPETPPEEWLLKAYDDNGILVD